MPTDAVTPIGIIADTPEVPTRQPKQQMDGEVFLHLLVTQLRNQDPTNSMDTSQLVTQTTSLAMMEALTKIDATTQEAFSLQMRTTAADLIGRQVSYLDADGTTRTGTATSVSYLDRVPVVAVDGQPVRLDAISEVRGTEASTTTPATDGHTTATTVA